ncbi:unnamed protein product [Ectocarpus sp. 4 AP-2014]
MVAHRVENWDICFIHVPRLTLCPEKCSFRSQSYPPLHQFSTQSSSLSVHVQPPLDFLWILSGNFPPEGGMGWHRMASTHSGIKQPRGCQLLLIGTSFLTSVDGLDNCLAVALPFIP